MSTATGQTNAALPQRVLAKLACPQCRTGLVLVPGDQDAPEIPALRCSTCGETYPIERGVPLLFPRQPAIGWTAAQQQLYDGVAPHYDGSIPAHVAAHYLAKRVRLVRSLAPAGATVVDIGCGTGTLAAALRSTGYDVYGADASTGMLAQMGSAGRGVPVAGFCERLPFLSQTFDVAITVATLHHISHPGRIAQTIGEMCRVVRPGGAVVVWDHNPKNPYWPMLMKRVPQDTGEERLIPQEEIVAAFHAAGVRDLSTHRSGLVPDFTPPALLGVAQFVEAVVERTPGASIFCAHNVVVGRKRDLTPGPSHVASEEPRDTSVARRTGGGSAA